MDIACNAIGNLSTCKQIARQSHYALEHSPNLMYTYMPSILIGSSATCIIMHIHIYRTWEKFGGRKFWRIITDEANGEENFGESAGKSSVISLYL